MKNITITLILFFQFQVNIFAQTFELLISSDKDDIAWDALELNDNTFVVVSQSGDYLINDYPEIKLFRIESSGKIIDSTIIQVDPNFQIEMVKRIYETDGGEYLLLSRCKDRHTGLYKLYINAINSNFEPYFEVVSDNDTISDFFIDGIVNSNNNIISVGFSTDNLVEKVMIVEMTSQGEIVRRNDFSLAFAASAVLEIPEKSTYFLNTAYSGFIVELDSQTLDILDTTELPGTFRPDASIRYQNDTIILLVGRKYVYPIENNRKLFFIKSNLEGEILAEYGPYGQPDTNYYSTGSSDFIDSQNFYMAGTHNFTESPPLLRSEPRWIFMNKLKTDGTIIWQRFYKGELNYMPYKVLATADGGALILSHKYDWNGPYPNQRDIHILKIDSTGWYEGLPPVGTDEYSGMKQILVYPNPAKDQVHFEPGLYTDLELQLFDQTGNLLLTKPLQSHQTVDVSGFKAGVYIYVIQNKNGFLEKGKLVKE